VGAFRRPGERDSRHLPGEGVGGRSESDIDDATASDLTSDELAVDEALAGSQLELAQVDRPAAQAHTFGVDLPHSPRADEDVPTLNGDDEAVYSWRSPAGAEDHVHDAAHVSPVCPDQRPPNEPRDIDNAVRHRLSVEP
jgi:hypothetical protein